MSARRRASRTFSYSTRFRISEGSSSFTGSVLEPVRVREHLDRMLRLPARPLLDLERGQRAVRRRHGGAGGSDRVEERLGRLERELVVLLLEAPRAVHRGAL